MNSKSLVEEFQIAAREEWGCELSFEEAQASLSGLVSYFNHLAEMGKPLIANEENHGD